VLTGLEWAAAHAPGCRWVASFATDAPFQPPDLVARLLRAVEEEGADLACARSGGQDHPVFGLWPVRLAADLRRAMVEEGMRKVDAWTGRYRLAVAEFAVEPIDTLSLPDRSHDLIGLANESPVSKHPVPAGPALIEPLNDDRRDHGDNSPQKIRHPRNVRILPPSRDFH